MSTTLSLHSANPHYFSFRGKPTIMISSAEHYGAVINLDFDYIPYLDMLHANGFNLTRIFSGSFVETEQSISWAGYANTLAPKSGKLLAPWARSGVNGYINGGNKFDLSVWDDAYFVRLQDFCRQASIRDIIVQVVLFGNTYNEQNWHYSPLYIGNNINHIGDIRWDQFVTADDQAFVEVQQAMTRKIVLELQSFDNVYYEICNEPDMSLAGNSKWHELLIHTVVEAESAFAAKHLIAVNSNWELAGCKSVQAIDLIDQSHVSVINWHYGWIAEKGLARFYASGKAAMFDETWDEDMWHTTFGLRGEAWEFMLSGGAGYNHLSFAYTPDDVLGAKYQSFRSQLKFLKQFMESLDFIHMHPDPLAVVSADPESVRVHAFSKPGAVYALYVRRSSPLLLKLELPPGEYSPEWVSSDGALKGFERVLHPGGKIILEVPNQSYERTEDAFLILQVPAGAYKAEWTDPASGKVEKVEFPAHQEGHLKLFVPPFKEDIVLKLTCKG